LEQKAPYLQFLDAWLYLVLAQLSLQMHKFDGASGTKVTACASTQQLWHEDSLAEAAESSQEVPNGLAKLGLDSITD
jgi:hypothetical protein